MPPFPSCPLTTILRRKKQRKTPATSPLPLSKKSNQNPNPNPNSPPMEKDASLSGSNADQFSIRSGVRAGHKRELAFALKSQAEFAAPLGRTRSRNAKKAKRSDGGGDGESLNLDGFEATSATPPPSQSHSAVNFETTVLIDGDDEPKAESSAKKRELVGSSEEVEVVEPKGKETEVSKKPEIENSAILDGIEKQGGLEGLTIPGTSNGDDHCDRRLMPASTSNSSGSKTKKIASQKNGKLTKKDVGLHKLIFTEGLLPQEAEVGYYVRGKVALKGCIQGSGILCFCCDNVVTPSQFEAHAGEAQRRKPYNHIYLSNGMSLHEASVRLSKEGKLPKRVNDDLCSICADGGDLLLCDYCPRAFHIECVGLSSIPNEEWCCRYCQNMRQREEFVERNDNAIAAGRVAGVDPLQQIYERCIRTIKLPDTNIGGCVFCREHDCSTVGFGPRTVILCDQCEKEHHVGCLKANDMCDLKELPEAEWFCCIDCSGIYATLHEQILRGVGPLPEKDSNIIKRKYTEKGKMIDSNADTRWGLLHGRTTDVGSKLLLSRAVFIFHELFDPIVDSATRRDLIPSMVYGRKFSADWDFNGMYCAVLTVGSSVRSAAILRVFGSQVAELPLVATDSESQGLGYFQALYACIERLLASLRVKHLVLPSAEEAESIWIRKFGFSKITTSELNEYTQGSRPMIFEGTSMLHKLVPSNLEVS